MADYDVICIGAGPTGLATAIEAKRAGMRALVLDKGCLCNSIYHYPVNMVFFTTPELLEIGDLPLALIHGPKGNIGRSFNGREDKPGVFGRKEALGDV